VRIAYAMPLPTDSPRVNRHAYGWQLRHELAAALYALAAYAARIAVCRETLADPLLPPHEVPRVQQNIAATAAMAARPH
jgi:hypothetical protein